MLSYVKQLALCESIRENIKGSLARSNDFATRLRANDLPTNESILRAVSLLPAIDTEEALKSFVIDQLVGSLRLTADQREQLNLNNLSPCLE